MELMMRNPMDHWGENYKYIINIIPLSSNILIKIRNIDNTEKVAEFLIKMQLFNVNMITFLEVSAN